MTNTNVKTSLGLTFIILTIAKVAILLSLISFALVKLFMLVSADTNPAVGIIAVVATMAIASGVIYLKKR